MGFDRKFLVWALGYLAFGMVVGIYMAASGNHAQHVAHAHILLVGFVLSLSYGLIHRLWLAEPGKTLARLQFVLHQASAVVMFAGLLMLYGNVLPLAALDPVLGVASIGALAAALLMLYMVATAARTRSA